MCARVLCMVEGGHRCRGAQCMAVYARQPYSCVGWHKRGLLGLIRSAHQTLYCSRLNAGRRAAPPLRQPLLQLGVADSGLMLLRRRLLALGRCGGVSTSVLRRRLQLASGGPSASSSSRSLPVLVKSTTSSRPASACCPPSASLAAHSTPTTAGSMGSGESAAAVGAITGSGRRFRQGGRRNARTATIAAQAPLSSPSPPELSDSKSFEFHILFIVASSGRGR